MQKQQIKLIFGIIGTIVAQFFYIAPVVPCIKLIKDELSYKNYPGILLVCSSLNCLLWFVYGIEKNELMVYLANGLGVAITEIWIIIYILFVVKTVIIYSILVNLGIVVFQGGIFVIFHVVLNKPAITSKIAMVMNILMYAAPGEKIYKVLKTNDYTILPISSSICGVICCTCWLIYGIYLGEISMIIPNALGDVFSVLQIIVYVVAKKRAKTRGIIKEDGENNNENTMEEKVIDSKQD